MSEQPWTPGPWQPVFYKGHRPMHEVRAGESPADAIARCYRQGDATDANAALIALAPEMAASIIAWEGRHGHMHSACECDDCHTFEALAVRLRGIGGKA
jgi:hypothetical protein